MIGRDVPLSAGDSTGRPLIVYLPGVAWDAVAGTDRRLVEELSQRADIVWVDPAGSVLRSSSARMPWQWRRVDEPLPGVTRLRTVGPPGVTRPGPRAVARVMQERALRSFVGHRGRPYAVILSDPDRRFPPQVAGRRVHYVTDDWISGAALMGLPVRRVAAGLDVNLRAADIVVAVSPTLAADLEGRVRGLSVGVLPNGGPEVTEARPASGGPDPDGSSARPAPRVGLVGQLNERLDLDLLEEVTHRGIDLVVLGPRTDRDPVFGARLTRWLAEPGVDYRGMVEPEDFRATMSRLDVGLTPYLDTPFNRASFPLKTLDYLAAGLAVVSSDLPASRWFDSPDILIGGSPAAFAELVEGAARVPADPSSVARRLELARRHTWSARAEQVLDQLRILG